MPRSRPTGRRRQKSNLLQMRRGQTSLVVASGLARERSFDLPARWLSSGGRALWVLNARDDIGSGVAVDTGNPQEGWNGQIIFALWPDEQFSQRLADTGWQNWQAVTVASRVSPKTDLTSFHATFSCLRFC